jgi:uncharacterized protein YrzB (UPF0473 family)
MDYIYITCEDGNEKKMEVVSIFELDGYESKYIIYSELDKSHYYLAKYKDNIEELDTNLTDKEMKLCNTIFEEIMK